jgi:hypothetical protein
MPVVKQKIPNTRQWTGWKAVFPAQSAPMAAFVTMDTVTEEQCILCGTCLEVISRTISECGAVEVSEVERDGW